MHDTSVVLLDGQQDEEKPNKASELGLEHTSSHAMCAMRFDLEWRSEIARHTDCRVMPKLNLWRDIFPPELESQVLDKPRGCQLNHHFKSGELLGGYQNAQCLEISSKAFNRKYRKGNTIEPRAGRFYPRGFIAGTRGIFPEELTPFRIGKIAEQITVDLNHPLARYDLSLSTRILDIWAAGDEHGGACQDIAELVTEGGPGMQTRWRELPTDFWSDIPYIRFSPEVDLEFYQQPRLVEHLDAEAIRQVEAIYQRLIPKGAEILDLMSSWKSHLSPALEPRHVAGLGMNQQELDANPLLAERLVHDLNLKPELPYASDRFDAVVCTVSVEYLIKPLEVFAEIQRILKPGGRFIVTFSNRWFPPKVVRIWEEIHEFERMGLVLEYFLRAGGFGNLETWSMRGLPRPADDKYAAQLAFSDPVYAVWGEKF